MPANAGRSACATCPTRDAERPGEAAVELHVELRLLPARRQADVHRARHLRAPPSATWSASCVQHRRCPGPRSWIWICFWSPKPLVGIDAVDAAELRELAARSSRGDVVLAARRARALGISRT